MSSAISADGALYGLRTGGRVEPLGVPSAGHVLSWAVASDADLDRDTPFSVSVAKTVDGLDAGATDVWCATSDRPWLVYDDEVLRSRARRYWQVRAVSRSGQMVTSPVASFEVGLAGAADWSAQWITAPRQPFARESWDPCPYLRCAFDAGADDISAPARLYITALGLYRVWLNGVVMFPPDLGQPDTGTVGPGGSSPDREWQQW